MGQYKTYKHLIICIKWLKEHFKKRIISKKFEIEWAPYSPDLSLPDFFLWGYLKDRVYREKPRTLNDLKKKIKMEIRTIKPTVFKDVMNNFCVRLKKYNDLNGAHFEHLI